MWLAINRKLVWDIIAFEKNTVLRKEIDLKNVNMNFKSCTNKEIYKSFNLSSLRFHFLPHFIEK